MLKKKEAEELELKQKKEEGMFVGLFVLFVCLFV